MRLFKRGGILGGMGVDVTAELLRRIIDATGAAREQDNLPLVVDHNPTVPDRTEAIVRGGANPLPAMKASLARLVQAGADFIAIPCNTAHHYYTQLQAATPVYSRDTTATSRATP